MAEADEGAKSDAIPEPKPEIPSHGVPPHGVSPHEAHSAETPSPAPASNPNSEWTASDSRGPLIEAGAEGTGRSDGSADQELHPVGTSDDTPEKPDEPMMVAAATANSSRRSSWPIALGLIGGAVIGAGSALYVDRTNGGSTVATGSDPQVAALSDKVAALQSQSDEKVAALQKTLANLSKAAASPTVFDPAPLKQDMAALKANVADLRKDSAGAEGIDTKFRDLGARLDGIESGVAALKKDSTTSQSGLQSLRNEQQILAGKVGSPALAVVSDSLVQAIGHGQPYVTQLDALASFGADPAKLAVLKQNAQTGVASAKILAAKFAPLTEPILATEHKAPANAGFMDRLKSGMSSLVSVRRADDFSGTDLSSRVGRIQSDLSHEDLTDALATWDALPADAKAKSDAWGALLKASADAMATARTLQMQAIAAMSAKKS